MKQLNISFANGELVPIFIEEGSFREWMAAYKHKYPYTPMSGLIFREIKFDHDMVLEDLFMEECTFINCTFEPWITFQRGTLNKSSFEDCTFNQTTFRGCSMKQTKFFRCLFKQPQFVDADMKTIYFKDCELAQASLRSNNLFNAHFYGCVFIEGNLHHTSFAYTTLRNTNVRHLFDLPSSDLAIAAKVAEQIIRCPETLDMTSWDCGPNHCLAGWAIHFGGEHGKVLENIMTTDTAASILMPSASHLFFDTDDPKRVYAWAEATLKAKAEADKLLPPLQDDDEEK